MTQPLVTVRNLTMRFGGVVALNQVEFDVNLGEITAIIGPNGAGKTTVFNCMTGFYRASEGEIHLQGVDGTQRDLIKILGGPFQSSDWTHPKAFIERVYYKLFGGAYLATRAGVVRTFQNVRLFKEMTAMENLLVAQRHRVNCHILAGLLQTKNYKNAEAMAVEQAWYWLDFFHLSEDGNRLAKELPYGHQRRLEMARALCVEPKLLCLDEPAAGLNPNETCELSGLIRQLLDEHQMTICLIEHDMGLVMGISDHVVVLDHGEVIARGTPQAIQNNPLVLEAYLGAVEEEER